MTQTDPLSLTIVNVVVDVVVRHWVHGVVEEAEAQEKRDSRGGIRQYCYMPTRAWSPRRTPPGSRAHLTHWWAYLTGWACRKMLGRQWAWCATPDRQRET